jgi:hypothetical protein
MAVNDIVMGAAGASGPATFIEDVFSTYLYTGNGTSQTITNGIDLSGKGGLVWIKSRSTSYPNILVDTARGATKYIISNANFAEQTAVNGLTAFNSTGFSLGSDSDSNFNNATYASWTFREQPKFFDIVTYTGNGVGGRNISHNLGSAPGCIIVKRTDSAENWFVYHRSNAGGALVLNTTDNGNTYSPLTTYFGATPTASVFTTGSGGGLNNTGGTYVAYLFAHDAGGFGATGTDNVISCGSYTGNGSTTGPVVTLGYEPQWIMIKNASDAQNWQILDNMRGITVNADVTLRPNLNTDEVTVDYVSPTATGFQITGANAQINANTNTYIYIAIRRGPMKTPETGTSVFNSIARTGTGTAVNVTNVGFSPDLLIDCDRNSTSAEPFKYWWDRLRGTTFIYSSGTAAEAGGPNDLAGFDVMNGVRFGSSLSSRTNGSGFPYINWFFKRAPGFFDVVCYTGTGVAGRTVNHNLTVAPEMMVVKSRSDVTNWRVYHSSLGATKFITLDTDAVANTNITLWNNTEPTASVFSLGTTGSVNANGSTFVAYLFASIANVSKVGSYTGTGATQTINAGLASGARFVMIKRTDNIGNWFVWDTARGMVAGTDPRLALNSTAAELNNNWVYTASTGFQIVTTDASVNASGGSYIYLAIA